MKIQIQKTKWTGLAWVLAMLTGSPALADDTELLLRAPDPSQIPKPNVMFILDTSGSMTTVEATAQPYNSSITYGGACDNSYLYWTDTTTTPVCNGSNTRFISKTAYHCAFSTNQINGIGSFTNTMVQYRSDSSGAANWTTLAPGNSSDPVECQSDSGQHGDGTPNFVYASSGAGLPYPWSILQTEELSWGSAPRNVSYTVYDANYLNWKASPVSANLSRINIVKQVTKKVLASVNDMNVGLMRFNDRDGGPVILAMQDLDSNRAAINAKIDGLPAAGRTPLSETMYENALYWLGRPAYYGERINQTPTDPNALVSSGPEVYKQPDVDACAKNYNVLLTDGAPVDDQETPALAPTLPNFSTVMQRSACTFTTMGDCLDDITEYLSKVDTNSTKNGTQSVTTHTIGFSINLPILRDAALNSGGEYFLASDVESLTLALLQIIANINDRSMSFSAPAVSVNTFNRTQNLNDLYLTVFGAEAKVRWPGNLKKFRVAGGQIVDANGAAAVDPMTGFFYDSTRSLWTPTTAGADGNDVRLGGAANRLPDPTVRKLYTNQTTAALTAASNQITPSNAMAFTDADFGLTGATGEPTKDQLIRWMRGEDIADEDNNPATTVRNAMGDPLHSQPAALVYGGTPTTPDIVVFSGTNDGYLHAVDGTTGTELWSYVPKQLLDRQTRLFINPDSKYKNYGIDGNIIPIVKDENKNGIVDGNDFVVLIFGMRRGGLTYYALNVTDKNVPQLLWTRTLTDAGQSWSTPTIARMDIGGASQNADKAVVVLGGGYDPVHDSATHPSTADALGAGVHVLDLQSGATLWRGGPDSGASKQFTGMTRAIATQVRAIDVNVDGLADRMYASDLGGQIWRFDIVNGQSASTLVNGGVIAQLGAEGMSSPGIANTRRFYNSPDLSLFNDVKLGRRFISISIGSGYRAHPLDTSVTDRFYSLRDPNIFKSLTQTEYNNYAIIKEADLVEVSGQKNAVVTKDDAGWMFTLPSDQMVLADSITFDNSVFFVAFSPESNTQTSCTAGRGTNFLYRVDVVNGDPVIDNLDTLDPNDADDARRQTLAQGGIAPTPTILFPGPDDNMNCVGQECAPPPIGCVGVECFDPGFENNPVRTLWTQDGIE